MSFMDEVKKAYNKVSQDIKTNPRKCEHCGCIETMDNLILRYNVPYLNKSMLLCDDCMFDILE